MNVKLLLKRDNHFHKDFNRQLVLKIYSGNVHLKSNHVSKTSFHLDAKVL